MDPEAIVRPTKGQIDDLVGEINARVEKDQRVLVTTLTKKMSEDLTNYLLELGIRVRYLHSEVDTLERVEILRGLRLGEFDVLVGINLLREGLDLPEVALVAILDADKEGFLRSATSLIQTMGRAARNVDGQVIMYADQMTDSMRKAISETQRRRQKQSSTTPSTASIRRRCARRCSTSWTWCGPARARTTRRHAAAGRGRSRNKSQRSAIFDVKDLPPDDLGRLIQTLQEEMHEAAKNLRFEEAAPPARRDHRVQARAAIRQLTGPAANNAAVLAADPVVAPSLVASCSRWRRSRSRRAAATTAAPREAEAVEPRARHPAHAPVAPAPAATWSPTTTSSCRRR